MTTRAATVSATLRRAGFNPASASDWNRQGLKAKQSGDRVWVYADLDNDDEAREMANDAADALAVRGYSVSPVENAAFYTTRPANRPVN